jgi:excisionase family DNA binding protein
MTHTVAARPDESAPNAAALLDTATVAELLACSPRTVTNLITRGALPAVRLGPGRSAYRVPATALLEFVSRWGHSEPADVAVSLDPDQLAPSAIAPVLLTTRRSARGLLLVAPAPPDLEG